MSKLPESAILRIFDQERNPVGAGFLVANRLAVTCAHVIATALGLEEDHPKKPKALIHFDLPLVEPGKTITAKIIFWDMEQDVAGLKIDGGIPEDASPAPLKRAGSLWGNTVRAYGFPPAEDYEMGVWAKGVLRSDNDKGWLQIDKTERGGYAIQPGFSGGPIWNDKLQGVVGMAIAADTAEGGRAAFMIPVSVIKSVWEDLPTPLAPAYGIPDLPPHYIPRTTAINYLKSRLFAQGKIGISGKGGRLGLQGMGGIGKSVLATALAHDPEIHEQFPNGIFWITVGQTPDRKTLQVRLAKFAGAEETGYTDELLAKDSLRSLFENWTCLLVLDDVWNVEDASALDVLGEQGCLLITTRNADVVKGLSAEEYSLDFLTDAQALILLADWAGQKVSDLPLDAHSVVQECGNLPLALSMVGAFVQHNPENWERVLYRLRNADLGRITQIFPDYPHRDLLRALQVSVDALPEAWQPYYLELAVFPEDTPIPVSVMETFWALEGLNKYDVRDIVDALVDRSLARIDKDGNLTLHDLQYDYIRKQARDLKPLHQRLLEAYWKKCPNGWHSGPNDGYFFDHLSYHLHTVGRDHELEQLLLQFSWMTARLETSGITALLNDYENIPYGEESELGIVLSGLRMAAPVIRKPVDLAGQLFGHLLTRHSQGIQNFLAGISPGDPWLRPLNLALRQAGDPFLGIYRPHSGQITAVTLLPDGSRVVAASLQKTITLFDLESGNEIREFQDPRKPTEVGEDAHPKADSRSSDEGPIGSRSLPSVFVTPNGRFIVCTFGDGTSCGWNLENSEVTYALDNIKAVMPSVDGNSLITVENNHLKIRDWASGEILQSLEDVGENIQSIATMADVDRVIVVTNENYQHDLKICNIKTGKVEQVLPCGYHDEKQWISWSSYDTYYDAGGRYEIIRDRTINAVALTSDDRYIVSASRDGSLKVWDLQKEEIIQTLRGHSGSVNAVALIPGTLYAVSGSSDKTLKLWNIESGKNVRTFTGHSSEIWSISVTPDGKRAVSADRDSLIVWDLCSAEEDHTFVGFQREILRHLKAIQLRRQDRSPYSREVVPDEIRLVALHPNGKQLILVDKFKRNDDGSVGPLYPSDKVDESNQLMICELASGAINPIATGFRGTVNAITLTPDGQYVIAAAADKTLYASKIDVENEASILDSQSGDITAIALAPDGSFVVFGSSDGKLKALGFDRRMKVPVLQGEMGSVSAVAITPDGRYVIAASAQGILKLWDLSSGNELHTFRGHSGYVHSICITPDSKYIISASVDTTLKVWNIEKREELVTLHGHSGSVNAVGVTPDGGLVVSASDDETIKVWDIQRHEVLQTLKGHLGAINAVIVTQDGKHIISNGPVLEGSFVLAWNIERGNQTNNLMWHFGAVRAITLSRDGKHAVSASEDGTLKVWDLNQGTVVHVLKGHRSKVFGAAITPDGRFVVSGSGGHGDNSIKLWDLNDGSLVRNLPGHSGLFSSVNAVAITPDGRHVISASGDNTLKVWEMDGGQEVLTLEGHSGPINAAAVTPGGKRIVSASADKTLKVWDLESGKEIHTLSGHSSYVNAVAVIPDGKYIVSASADKTLKVWDLESGEEVHTLSGHSSYVNAVAVMPDGKHIVSASADKTLKVWSVDSAEEIISFAAEAGLLCCATVEGEKIMAGDEEGWLYVFQLIKE
ncbi:MAG: trypsin-like peptidase domain-containing protein [Anaerolineales bacterium]|nr:trypsin-like peptidase domain-containing protein [Anaerolineales bacterium]